MKLLFGENIPVNCLYCDNFNKTEGSCLKNRVIKDGKCSKFRYNPTLRTPKSEAALMQFSKEDFEL